MTAVVLESVSFPSARTTTPRIVAAAAPVTLQFRSTSLISQFKGLRVACRPPLISPAARQTSNMVSRRGAVFCEAQSTALDVPDVTSSTWQTLVMEADGPVLVEFWAPWCGPCRTILPIVAKLSKDYEDRVKCFKLSTDESPDIATQYGVRSIPTVIIFKSGEKKDAVIGSVPESTLAAFIDRYV